MFWKQNNLLKFSFSQKISEKWICFTLHFLYLSFSIVSPGKAIFFFQSGYISLHAPISGLSKIHSVCAFPWNMFPYLILWENSFQKRGQLLHAILLSFITAKFICLHLPLRLKINQGIGSRTGWALDKIQPETVRSVDPDC